MTEKPPAITNPFKPQLRLVIQASVPVAHIAVAEAEYNNLRIFLLAISPDITLNGQIVKMLEPCCKKKQESTNNEKNT